MVLLLIWHAYELPITSTLVCCLYPPIYGGRLSYVHVCTFRYYRDMDSLLLTIFYSMLLLYCYLVGFVFRIVVVGPSKTG